MLLFLEHFFWGKGAYRTYWYVFLLSFPFTWRKVLVPSFGGGSFNEYMDWSLYVSDIFLLLSLFLILKHLIFEKSILIEFKVFHVEHLLIFLTLLYVSINFLRSENYFLWLDAILAWIRIFGIAFTTLYFLRDLQTFCSTWNKKFIFLALLILPIIFQSSISLLQYQANHSLGLSFVGESVFSEYSSGTAKIDLNNYQKQIRSYGTFLHPNILGGYLVVILSAIILFLRKKMFHVEHCMILVTMALGILALYLTHSKSAIFAFVTVMSLYLFHVEQIKTHFLKMFHVEQIIFVIIIIILGVFLLGNINKQQLLKSFQERQAINAQYSGIDDNIWFGQGLGQDVYLLDQHTIYSGWRLQPIHNIYQKFLFEWGVIGSTFFFACFLFMIIKYHNVPRGTNNIYYSLTLIELLIIGLFDHYLLDIYTGNVLFGIALGLICFPFFAKK